MINALFIDDEQTTLDLLEDLFSAEKQVYTATDGPSALFCLRQTAIEEVYVDILLAAEENGYKLAQDIQNLFPQITIFLMSSLDKDFVREQYGDEFNLISKIELVLTAPNSFASSPSTK